MLPGTDRTVDDIINEHRNVETTPVTCKKKDVADNEHRYDQLSSVTLKTLDVFNSGLDCYLLSQEQQTSLTVGTYILPFRFAPVTCGIAAVTV